MIGLLTDSSSQLPQALAERFGAIVVPITVTIAGRDHLEGVDLNVDDFYALLASDGGPPDVTTSQPSAAAFIDGFEELVAKGASAIVAVLVGSGYSGAVNSASVAAAAVQRRHPGVSIEVIDSGTASFGISCAVWAAADAIADGASVADVRDAALARAALTGSVFVIEGTELAEKSGRFGDVPLGATLPVLASGPEGLTMLGEADAPLAAVDLMVDALVARAPLVRVAVGRSSAATDSVTDVLLAKLSIAPNVVELIEYRVGPSIAVHTGPNTVGGFSFPA